MGGVQQPAFAAFSGARTAFERLQALDSPPRPAGMVRTIVVYLPGVALGTLVGFTLAHLGQALGPACLTVTRCVG
jgi:hypothetical protein